MKVGILNVTGYAGVELARILFRHPAAEITSITGRSMAGKSIGEVFPHLAGLNMTITEDITESVDVVFSALPHAASAERLAPLIRDGVKVVDISADFRLKDLAEYESWYDTTHPCPEFLEEAVYGLPELHKDEVEGTNIVGNPGCYPSAAILALAPALKAGIIEPEIIVDAKSGVSGAGRGFSFNTHYSEVNESVKAYGIDGHRHLPEIVQELSLISPNGKLNLTFTPHLIPMTRGIFASCYAPLKEGAISSGKGAVREVKELYHEFYKNEPFANVVAAPPATKHTLGSNECVIYPTVDTRTNRLMVFSCLDNLVKGAAGQAVQNMNLMFGLPEDEGLNHVALYP